MCVYVYACQNVVLSRHNKHVQSEVLIAVIMKSLGICSLVECETYCIHLQGQRVHHTTSHLKTIHSCCRYFYQTTQHIPDDTTFHTLIQPFITHDSQPTTAKLRKQVQKQTSIPLSTILFFSWENPATSLHPTDQITLGFIVHKSLISHVCTPPL